MSIRLQHRTSTIGLVLRQPGGKWPEDAIRLKHDSLLPMNGFIDITTDLPDMISLENDPGKRRAKMKCGHVIGVQVDISILVLINLLRSLLCSVYFMYH